jgi:hypothetical protein
MNPKRYCAVAITVLLTVHADAQTRQKVRANDLKADVSFLASDALQGRGTPSPGLDVAAEYVAAQFRRAGLEPSGDDGYFQTANYQSVTPALDAPELTLEAGGVALKAERSAMAVQEPAAADLTHVPVVKADLGNAAAMDALTVEQVRGKVLQVGFPDSGSAGYSAMRTLSAAIARLDPALVIVTRKGSIGAGPRTRLREAATTASRVPILAVWDPAIRKAAEAAGEAAVSVHIPTPSVDAVKLRNVIGLLRGSDPVLRDTYVVVSAHYDHLGVRGSGEGDHIYNGANDDASGTASVIEAAVALAGQPERPKRSIVFMTFFGEESGELGSRFYCQHPVFPPAATVADVNLEQLGRTDDTEGPRVLQFNLTGFDYTDIAATFSKAGGETGIRVVKHERNSDAFFGASDNAAFAEIGIPSTTLSVSYIFPDYHKPGDEWTKLDYENMAKVDDAIVLGVFRIADSVTAPQWNGRNPQAQRYIQAREKKVEIKK